MTLNRRNRLMLVVGTVLAALAFIAVLAFGGLGQKPSQDNQNADVSVVVAAAELPLGTQVSADQLAMGTRPKSESSGTYSSPDDVVGQVVRRAVGQGQALTAEDFQTGTSVPELVRSLRSGLRAMAVPVSANDSVASVVQPGDYVDVILSLEERDAVNPVAVPNPQANVPTADGGVPQPYISIDDVVNNTSVKVVVQNVQVLATLSTPSTTDQNSSSADASAPPEVVVLLAVTPQQAEVVRFAQLDGNVSMVLRAPSDYAAGDTQTTGITLKELVDNWGVLPPQPVTP